MTDDDYVFLDGQDDLAEMVIGQPVNKPRDPAFTVYTGGGWVAWLDYGGRIYQQRDGKRARRVRVGPLRNFMLMLWAGYGVATVEYQYGLLKIKPVSDES